VIENCANGDCFAGVQIASQRVSERSGKGKDDDTFFGHYVLRKRPYLGPTSTIHELAFLMANQAMVTEGDLVCDLFVGSGSIAIAL